VKARVVFACKECKTGMKEGEKCAKKGCKNEGKAVEPRCSRNGTFPHGGKP
jgi:hypothetical protein